MTLYPHQEIAKESLLAILEQNSFAYLHGAERIGKTLAIMSVAKELGVESVMFVTVKKAIPSIEQDYKVGEFEFKLGVINYESVHKIDGKVDMIVYDEAHKLSSQGRQNKTVKACLALNQRMQPKYRIGMSATPHSESVGQLYHQFKVLGFPFPHHMRTHNISHQTYGIPNLVYRSGGIQQETYKEWKPEFKNLFEPYMFAMDRYDAEFDIPQVTLTKVPCEMHPELKNYYYEIVSRDVHDDLIIDSDIKRFAKSKQLCGGTIIMDSGEKHIYGHRGKINAITNISFQKQKIAIYCHYRAEIELLKGLYSGMATEDYQEFKDNPDMKFFIAQQTSGAFGIDLSFCDAHIIYSFSYSGTVFEQSTNRMLNKKRKEQANVFVLVTKNSLENRAFESVSQKRNYNIASYRKDRRKNGRRK